jgi:DNA-binding transcriptional ArsR family regulator
MGISKTKLFEQKEVNLAKVCKALGHPARVRILEFLLKEKTASCNTIVEHLPLAQSTVSQHLSEMKIAGLLNSTGVKTSVVYSVDMDNLAMAQKMLSALFFPKVVQQTLF